MGLGGGGPSRLGRSSKKPQAESEAVVRAALEGGVNIFDSSESYGTEPVMGAVLKDVPRDEVVICSKLHGSTKGHLKTPQEVEGSLDKSLANLKTDHLDVYMIHAVAPHRYDVVVPAILPTLLRMKEKGKIRFVGITEIFGGDRGHAMLPRALEDDHWDVVMVGFNILNSCARERVLSASRERGVGVFNMFAVRRALRDLATLDEYVRRHIDEGKLTDEALELADIVRGMIDSGECRTLPELAYRYCLHEPGITCVLSGTGSVEHLRENLRAAELPPLGADLRTRLEAITGGWDHLAAQ